MNRLSSDELNELLQGGYRYALALTHDVSASEDLVQEACAALVRAKGPWTKPYFFRTIRNQFIDDCRRRDRMRELEETLADEATVEDTDITASQEEVERALADLRPTEREVIYLSAVESYTAQEIADLRGCPRGTVLSLLHRAKARLRETLERRRRKELYGNA